jgi:hypothetical protein
MTVASVAVVFTYGQLVRLACTFEDADGVAVDPDEVIAKVKPPSGDVVEYTVGASEPSIVNDAEGSYYLDIEADEVGLWHFRFESSGTGAAADEGRFKVAASEFAA